MNLLDLLKQYMPQILAWLQNQFKQQMQKPEPAPQVVQNVPKPAQNAIDWNDPKSHITEHFTVGDACTLHSWNRLANEADGFDDAAKEKIVLLCKKMEEVRTFLGCSINVHCMFRSQKYNQEVVKAIPNDVHAQSLACDFDCNPNMTIEQVHAKMEPALESLGMRMEKGTATWVHLDLRAPGPSGRYFTA